MSARNDISDEVKNVWARLNSRWQGEDADAFYNQYIVALDETAELFEADCSKLTYLSDEFEKELQLIEQSLTD